jgi:hypothetical protein
LRKSDLSSNKKKEHSYYFAVFTCTKRSLGGDAGPAQGDGIFRFITCEEQKLGSKSLPELFPLSYQLVTHKFVGYPPLSLLTTPILEPSFCSSQVINLKMPSPWAGLELHSPMSEVAGLELLP